MFIGFPACTKKHFLDVFTLVYTNLLNIIPIFKNRILFYTANYEQIDLMFFVGKFLNLVF